jgi:hypothetical protein
MPGDTATDGTEQIDEADLEREADEITTVFNEAAPDYSSELEWFGMTLDHDTCEQQFVMEAKKYIDRDGLNALRDAGWQIQYIEAHNHEYDDDVVVSIALPVRGGESDV